MQFTGDAENLNSLLSAHLINSNITSLGNEAHKMMFRFNDETTLKQIISIANDAVELKSIIPSMPSMDEIFIHTVESYNKSQQ